MVSTRQNCDYAPALNSSTVAETALVCFRPSAIHGIGGFAKADIAAGTRVIEYIGEKITKAESLRRCESANEYIFSLDETCDLDGNVPWNPARFLNHSCDPNCEAEPDGDASDCGAVWHPGREEITFNYGYDLEDYREHPCRCGASDCIGYMSPKNYSSTSGSNTRWRRKLDLSPP